MKNIPGRLRTKIGILTNGAEKLKQNLRKLPIFKWLRQHFWPHFDASAVCQRLEGRESAPGQGNHIGVGPARNVMWSASPAACVRLFFDRETFVARKSRRDGDQRKESMTMTSSPSTIETNTSEPRPSTGNLFAQ